ncbi:MAG: ABC transporter permease [Planctomycetes bacterium]|nr:ABC transporter permease [Planctomycetota bacterium]
MTPLNSTSQDDSHRPTKARRSLPVRVLLFPATVGEWIAGAAERHWQNVLTALVQIWANKARSILTTLGIIIAVTSTITVVSFVQGFGNYVTDMLRGFGTNMVFVIPEFPSGMRGRMLGRVVMDIEDVLAVRRQCDKVRRITPLTFSNATVEYGREKVEDVQMRGATEQFQTIRSFFVDKGRFFGPIDVDQANNVCVLGRGVLKALEADEGIIGNYVFLNQERFMVLGLLEEKGNMMGNRQDDIVLIPFTTAIKMVPFFRKFLPFVIEATSEEDVEEASLQMTRVLRDRHGLQPGEPNDFRLLRQDEFLRDFERVKLVATTVLSGIVGISLIVGGIGIMNIMLATITERTREIGIRRAIGASARDITWQFLIETVTLATIGGLLGLALGIAGVKVLVAATQWHAVITAWSLVLAMAVSCLTGVIFGIYPARRAAAMDPIEALRHV